MIEDQSSPAYWVLASWCFSSVLLAPWAAQPLHSSLSCRHLLSLRPVSWTCSTFQLRPFSFQEYPRLHLQLSILLCSSQQ